jgi:alkylation response protein AidB-like acyl-CoA dehydrogenase
MHDTDAGSQPEGALEQLCDPALPGLSPVVQARDLVPLLRANAAESERTGRLTEESAGALRSAGFFAVQSPRRLGGHEADLRTAVDVYRELGRGCGSGAWISMILSGGSLMASLLGDQARDEVWGDSPGTGVCASLTPSGSARPVDGGVVASAVCRPLSGVHQAGWALVHVPVYDNGEVTERTMLLVPLDDVAVEETWHVAGLQATGSDTVVLDEVFVPRHRVLSFARMTVGGYAQDHPAEPLAATTVLSDLIVTVMGPVLGMAQAALEHTREILSSGKSIGASLYTDARRSPSVQFNVADAASLIDTALLHTVRAADDVDLACRAGRQLDLPTRARIRMDMRTAAQSARQAVTLLLNVGGARGFALSNPVQRLWREVETAARHPMLAPDLSREIYARVLLGVGEPVAAWV